MATSMMEEIHILKQRDKAIAALIALYPDYNIYAEDRGHVLRVVAPETKRCIALRGEELHWAWLELVERCEQLSRYAYPFPHRNYHWVDKKRRREWTLTRKN